MAVVSDEITRVSRHEWSAISMTDAKIKELEHGWRVRLEQPLKFMMTESEWQAARLQIYELMKADVDSEMFDEPPCI